MDMPKELIDRLNDVIEHWDDHTDAIDRTRKKFQHIADEVAEQANATQRFTAEDFAFVITI